MSIPVHRIAPWEAELVDMASYGWRFLAEGDSWFSFGSFFGNSLLDAMVFDRRTLIIQTAMPGDTLSRMADWWKDLNFANLLGGAIATPFDAITHCVSAGGRKVAGSNQSPRLRESPLPERAFGVLRSTQSDGQSAVVPVVVPSEVGR